MFEFQNSFNTTDGWVCVDSQSSKSRVLNLEMSDLTESDAGMYICMASNALGKVSQYVRLLVAGECRHRFTTLDPV